MDLKNLFLLFTFGTCLTRAQNPPNITEITPLNSTSFIVSWTITDPSHNYTIIIWTNLNTGVMDNTSTIVPVITNSYNVTGLNGYDNYNVSVIAVYSGGIMMNDTMTVYDPPTAAPMNITFPPDNVTNESFVIQWDAVMDFFTVNYTIRWYIGDNEVGMATVNGLSYTVTGLTANTSYSVTVVAINTCCGAGPVSDVVMVMTNNEPPTLPLPTTTTITATARTTPTPTPPGGGGGSSPAVLCNGVIIATACVMTFIMTLIAA